MKNKVLLLIVSTFLFALLTSVIILFAISEDDREWALFLIPILMIGHVSFLFFKLFLPYRREIKNENTDLTGNSNLGEFDYKSAKKISTHPLFGVLLLQNNDYYFDDQYFYEIAKERITKIELTKIIEINKDTISVSNRRVWYVKCELNGEIRTFRFLHNYTLWNNNFVVFLGTVKRCNPQAKVLTFSLLSM
ncbi:MAG: hypothetical protein QM660_08550 [Dysgonomonas sp.]